MNFIIIGFSVVVLALVARIIQVQILNRRYAAENLKKIEEWKRLQFDLRNKMCKEIRENLIIDEEKKIELLDRSNLNKNTLLEVLRKMSLHKVEKFYFDGDSKLEDASSLTKKCVKDSVLNLSSFLIHLEQILEYDLSPVKVENYFASGVPNSVVTMITFNKISALKQDCEQLRSRIEKLQHAHEIEMFEMRSKVEAAEIKSLFNELRKLV